MGLSVNRIRICGCIFTIPILFAQSAVRADTAPGVEVHTAHYDLYTEGPNPQESATILEQFYGQLQTFFGKEPPERLRVKCFSDRGRFVSALKAEGITMDPLPRGIYSPSSRTCFVLEQPSITSSRNVLLHECAHQFHRLAMMGNLPVRSVYYVEGLAEYFAHHRWDGKKLAVGSYSSISQGNVASQALNRFRTAHKESLRNIFVDGTDAHEPGNRHADYLEAYAFVTFLISRHPDEFHQLAGWLDGHHEAGSSWDYTFGKLGSRLDDEYRHWLELRSRLEPSYPRSGSWEQNNDWLEAVSEPHKYACLYLGNQRNQFMIEVKRDTPQTSVSLWSQALQGRDETFSFTSDARREKEIATTVPATHTETETNRGPRPMRWRMSANRAAGRWHIVVDGKEVASLVATDDSALYLLVSGTAEFKIESAR